MRVLGIWLILATLTNPCLADDGPVRADWVVRGGLVVDGTGKPGELADVAILGSRIVAVGRFSISPKSRVIDAAGLVVAPGFIDLHTHSDEGIARPKLRANANYLAQGVTTIVTGNCGGGPVDARAYFHAIEAGGGAGSNVIHLIPHGSLRRLVMGDANRAPTPAELAKLMALADREMDAGAWGMSTGLYAGMGMAAVSPLATKKGRVRPLTKAC